MRGEDPSYALNGAEVSIVEGVGAAEWGRSRPVGIPGAEVAPALDLADRLGIGQHSGKVHRLARTDRAQEEALDSKLKRQLARLVRAQGENGVGAFHFVDKDTHITGWMMTVDGLGYVFALAFGREIDAQPFDLDVADMQGGMYKAGITGAEGESPHRERRRVGFNVVGIDRQIFPGHLESAQERNVKRTQLHPAVITGREAL